MIKVKISIILGFVLLGSSLAFVYSVKADNSDVIGEIKDYRSWEKLNEEPITSDKRSLDSTTVEIKLPPLMAYG